MKPTKRRSSQAASPLGLIVLFACLALGVVIGAQANDVLRGALSTAPPPAPTQATTGALPTPTLNAATLPPPAPTIAPPTPIPAPALEGQVNLLILGVDGFDLPAPSLEAVWLALLHTEYKQVYLLGLSPDLLVTTEAHGPLRLREVYALDPQSDEGSPTLQASLATIGVPPLAGVLVVDIPLLVEVVDRFGGVDMNGVHVDGANALAYISMMPEPADPLAALDRQGEFLNALRRSASDLSISDPLPFAQLLIERGHSTLPAETLAALASSFAGLDLGEVKIQARPGDSFTTLLGPDGRPAVVLAQPAP